MYCSALQANQSIGIAMCNVTKTKKKGGEKSNLIYSTKSSLEDTKVEVKADRGASEQH